MADGRHGDIYIIRKKVSARHPHHGGAWKIAFADFMTAMMAFFLVLWIINASDKDTKTVIARYFNPVKLENPAKATKGVHGSTAAQTEGNEKKSDKPSAPPAKHKDPKGAPKPETPNSETSKSASSVQTPPNNMASAEARVQAAEAQLFASPYEALNRIAGGVGQTAPGASPEVGDADPQRLNGALSVNAFRDPFKPIGPGSPDDPVAFDADARNKAAPNLEPGKTGQQSKPAVRPLAEAEPSAKPHEKLAPGDALKPAPKPVGGPALSGEAAAQAAKGGAEAAKIEKEIKQQVAAVLKSGAGPDIEAKQTKDGLLISLTDKLNFSMFAIGSAKPAPELVRAMAALAKIVKARPGPIIVRGYTDARPYRNGAYDNWRLSSDRAQMAYYMLTRGGAPAARFVRVEGYADRAPRDAAHPLAAVNRRLEILIKEPKS